MTPAATVRPASAQTQAVVLVLYGGKADSHAPSRPAHLSAVRMIPYASALHRAGAPHVAVWTARYRFRGWNGAEASPVQDAREVLSQIRAEHPGVPIVLVGHSMGGRTALRVADESGVVGVVALAPWLPPEEPVEPVTGRRVLIVHGTRDKWTSPAGSLAWARRAEALTSSLRRIELAGVGHFMLRRIAFWHRITAYAVCDMLAAIGSPSDATRSRQSAGPGAPNTDQQIAETAPVVDPTALPL